MAWTIETEVTDWAKEAKVDETAGVVTHVPLCGNKSLNGYDIPPSAFGTPENCVALYDGKHVFIDHLPEDKLRHAKSRSVKEMAGVIRNPTFEAGRPYGDIHTKGCSQGALLLEAAKAQIPNLGLSHVARYRFKDSRKTSVEQVQEIATVDLVINPATTKNFSEQSKEDQEMSEKTIELLERQLAEEKTGRAADVKSRDEQITALKAEGVTLTESVKKLTAERDALNVEVVRFKSEQAMTARKAKIASQIEDAKLDAKLCPEALQAAWLTIESDDDRNKQIVAWKASLGDVTKTKPISRERQEGGDSKGEYNPEQDLKRFAAAS